MKDDIDVKMYLYQEGYGRFKEDHVFLKYNNIIIDPTYRQFFTDNSNNGISKYNNYLYNTLPPYFIGTLQDLNDMYNILKKSINEFGYSSINEDISKSVLNNWIEQKDITYKLDDNFNIIKNKQYLISKLKTKY